MLVAGYTVLVLEVKIRIKCKCEDVDLMNSPYKEVTGTS